MTKVPEPDATPAERVKDGPRMVAAIRQAVREALIRHKKLGNPVAIWRDGKVVLVPPEEIPDYENMPVDAG